MPDTPRKQVLIEYQFRRLGYRWVFAILCGLGLIASAHGYGKFSNTLLVNCNGGWPEAMVYVGGSSSAMAAIEILQWMFWRVSHRNDILLREERDALVRAGPENYNLVRSGGRLFLAPTNPMLVLVFGIMLLIACSRIGIILNPCEMPAFDWRALARLFLTAYTLLMLGAVVETALTPD